VLLTDVPAADANDYELIDSEGNSRTPPQSVPITISNTEAGDRVSVFKTTGVGSETLDRSMFAIQQAHTAPVGYIRVDPGTVTADTPTTGTIRVVRRNASGAILGEERYAYTGWTTGGSYDEFSLSGSTTIDYDTDDTAYVPYVDEEAGGASVSKSISYVADRNVLTRVRIVGMLPFKSTGTITNTGLPVTVIRTDDVIYQ
jgi:hypothetical protein